MTAPQNHKAAESSRTRMSDEIVNLRASVKKLARAQSGSLFHIKALNDQVQPLSGTVQHMIKAIPGAGENEARRQLH